MYIIKNNRKATWGKENRRVPFVQLKPLMSLPINNVIKFKTNATNSVSVRNKLNFKDGQQFTYFNLPIIGSISINLTLEQYPTASFVVKANKEQKDCVLEAFRKRSLPLFIDTYQVRDIGVEEVIEKLNVSRWFNLSFNCDHKYVDDITNFTYSLQKDNNRKKNPTFKTSKGTPTQTTNIVFRDKNDPVEFTIGGQTLIELTSNDPNINWQEVAETIEIPINVNRILLPCPLETTVKNYRYINFGEYKNITTTPATELSYLMSTNGLIINQRKLLENNVLNLVAYGDKIKEHSIDAGDIINSKSYSTNNDILSIYPTVFNKLTAKRATKRNPNTELQKKLDLLKKHEPDTLLFNFFAREVITELNKEIKGNLQNAFTFLPLSTESNEETDFLSQYSNDISNPYNNDYLFSGAVLTYDSELETELNIVDKEATFSGVNCDNIPLAEVNLNNLTLKTVRFIVTNIPRKKSSNEIECLVSADGDETGEGANFQFNYYTGDYKYLADNGGEVKQFTKICSKNGLPYSRQEDTYGLYITAIVGESEFTEVGKIKERITQYKFRDIKPSIWEFKGKSGITFRTVDGYITRGFDITAPQAPDFDSSVTNKTLYNQETIGNSREEVADFFIQLRIARKLPFYGELTNTYDDLENYYKDIKEQEKIAPNDFITSSIELADTRKEIELYNPDFDEEVIFSTGSLQKSITKTRITNVAKDENDRDLYTQYTENITLEKKAGRNNRILTKSFQQYEGRPSPVSYIELRT